MQRVSPWGVGEAEAKTPPLPFGSAERRNRHVSKRDAAVRRECPGRGLGSEGQGEPRAGFREEVAGASRRPLLVAAGGPALRVGRGEWDRW